MADYTSNPMKIDRSGQMIPTSAEEQEIVSQILLGFQQARLRRYNFETQWQESALLAWPEYANTFFYGYDQMPGQKKTMQQIDSSVSIASHRFGSIMDSIMTPSALMWSRLRHPDPYLMKQRGVKEYFDDFSRVLWQERYAPTANFIGQNQQNLQGLGVFGNMNMFVDELDPEQNCGMTGLRYTSVPVGNVYYIINHQGQVCGFYRTFRWTAQQFKQRWPDNFPQALQPALEQQSKTLYWGLHYVSPRSDYRPWEIATPKGKRWCSYYVSIPGHCILEEGGFRSFPMPVGRYMVAPDEDYGRGPMQMVLPAAKTKNAQKVVFLKQGHRAGDPIYLTPEEGILNAEFHPGSVNPGGMSFDGKRLIDIVPTGNIQITKEMMDEEGKIIDDAFLVTLFAWALKMEEAPNLSARQVVEMLEQRAIFLAPGAGRQQSEYLGSMVPREVDVLSYLGKLPPMPPVMMEAKAQKYDVEYTNPLTRAMQAGESAAYMQMVEAAAEVARSTGDNTVWDNFEWDVSLPEMADRRGVPVRWMATEASLKKKRQARTQAQERDQRAKEMPAQAAIMKAQAITAKAQAGQNIGGTLSGVPEQQMPEIPGNPQGQEGQPGVFGGPGQPGQPARP